MQPGQGTVFPIAFSVTFSVLMQCGQSILKDICSPRQNNNRGQLASKPFDDLLDVHFRPGHDGVVVFQLYGGGPENGRLPLEEGLKVINSPGEDAKNPNWHVAKFSRRIKSSLSENRMVAQPHEQEGYEHRHEKPKKNATLQRKGKDSLERHSLKRRI